MMSKMMHFALVGMAILASVQATPAEEDAVVGGTISPTDAYPFMTSLQTTGDFHFCGGSVIAPNVILTAAHCVSNGATNFRVKIGTSDLNSGRGQILTPTRVFVHESYNPNTLVNDIAVIQLNGQTTFAPVTMDTSSNTWQSGTAKLAGWGRTSGTSSGTRQLREVNLPVVSDAVCRASQITYQQLLRSSMMCTGYANGNRGACNGDSGGPLFVGNTQIGLTSWGLQGCVSYAVFTQVNSFESWINSKLEIINGGSGGGGAQPCRCVGPGEGLDAGETCGNWLNQGFNWCYSDVACPGATASARYPGYYWFECAQSRLDLALQMEQFLEGNAPKVVAEGSENFGSAAPASNIGLGVGIGAAAVAAVGAVGAVVYKKKKDAQVDEVIKRAESERVVAAPEI